MSRDISLITLNSFIKNKPENLSLHLIVVENSRDQSYKKEVIDLSSSKEVKITWVQNEAAQGIGGSLGNASGIKAGLPYVEDEYLFMCHCDIFIASKRFYEEILSKSKKGFSLIGTKIDNSRINAIHQSGLYVKTEIANACELKPQLPEMDVCDDLTKYCRENELDIFCFKNTFNNPSLIGGLASSLKEFHVDRCLDSEGNIMFMHLGRGIPKTRKTYYKPGRVLIEQWVEICQKLLNKSVLDAPYKGDLR
jgi:molybdopterin-guanine dinucleotide biosynthesis protein A